MGWRFLPHKFFFGENIIPNIVWLSIADGITRVSKWILIILITRFFTPSVYGEFSFAFNFVIPFAMLANFGTGRLVVRELSQNLHSNNKLSAFLGFRILTSVLAIIAILCLSSAITSDPVVQRLIFLFAGFIFLNSLVEFFYAIFQGHQRMRDQALVQILQSLVLLGGGFLVLINAPKIENIALLYLASGFIGVLICLLLARYYYKGFYFPRIDTAMWRHYFSLSWPIACIGIFTEVFARLDSIMMGYWNQFTAVGWYNAVYKLISVLFGIGLIFSYAFFPPMARAAQEANLKFFQLLKSYYILSGLILIPIIIILFFFPSQLINMIYGPSYLQAVLAFKLLIVALIFAFLLLPLKNIFIILNKQKIFLILLFITVTINFILNYFLIPKYSLNGAALATAISYFMLFISALIWLVKTRIIKV